MATTLSQNISDVIVSDPDRLGGEAVFKGTRVPVHTLFAYLRKGLSMERFLDDFEGVNREQALTVLELAESGILGHIRRP